MDPAEPDEETPSPPAELRQRGHVGPLEPRARRPRVQQAAVEPVAVEVLVVEC